MDLNENTIVDNSFAADGKMEVESESLIRQLSGIQDSTLKAILNEALEETFRRLINETNPNSKQTKTAEFGVLYAKTFSLLNILIDPSNSKTYTPFRTNLLKMSDLLNSETEDDKELTETFIHGFWTKCSCQKSCFTKTPISESLLLFKRERSMNKKTRQNFVGEVLLSFLSKKQEEGRNVFRYAVGGAQICRSFFQFIYGCSQGVIDRLQDCIAQGKPFISERPGNNKLTPTKFDYLDLFIKGKLQEWSLPNPEASGPEYFLPCNFDWKEVYDGYCKSYKETFSIPTDPMAWSTFYHYYTEEYDTFKRLSKKTDYCDTCSRLRNSLKEKELDDEEKKEKEELLSEHERLARRARSAYSEHRLQTAKEDDKTVISFDYAENVLLPILLDTPAQFCCNSLHAQIFLFTFWIPKFFSPTKNSIRVMENS